MLDEMLSKSGRRVAMVVMVVLAVLDMCLVIAEWGPAAWLIDWQGRLTGYYSLKLTGTLLLIPVVLAACGLALLWDRLTHQGRWRPPARVRIVKSSPGPAPDAYREAWVGLLVPVLTEEPIPQKDTGEACYLVPAEAGLAALAQASAEAAAWWRERMPDTRNKVFRFPASACERGA